MAKTHEFEPRRGRTADQTFRALQAQIKFLVNFCARFDEGDTDWALPAASILRNLFVRGTGTPLLSQLEMRGGDWINMAFDVPVIQDVDVSLLTATHLTGAGDAFAWPQFRHPNERPRAPFDVWFGRPIGNSKQFGSVTRKDLVRLVANIEASHVDPELPEIYLALLDGRFLSELTATGAHIAARPISGVAQACIRTIAHETLFTLHGRNKELFVSQYTWPLMPNGPVFALTLPGQVVDLQQRKLDEEHMRPLDGGLTIFGVSVSAVEAKP